MQKKSARESLVMENSPAIKWNSNLVEICLNELAFINCLSQKQFVRVCVCVFWGEVFKVSIFPREKFLKYPYQIM